MNHSIESVFTFMYNFIETEHNAYRIMLMNPDEEVLLDAWKSVNAFGAMAALNANITRFPDEPLLPSDEAKEELLSSYALRRLIKIEKYQIGNESIYAAYTTSTFSYDGNGLAEKGIAMRYIILANESGLQIVRRQELLVADNRTWLAGVGQTITLPDTPDEVVVYSPEENSA